MTARLASITIYPVKSLDGCRLPEAKLLPSGALEKDRRFAFFDRTGAIVNAKRFPQIQRIRSEFDQGNALFTYWSEDEAARACCELNSPSARRELSAWIANKLGQEVELRENAEVGFPDDLDSPGPTVVSTATLAAIGQWFPNLDLDEVRRRFRANLEVDGVEAFWEDRLYGSQGRAAPFLIGGCQLMGMNPCQRCAVPTRSSHTGETWPAFAKQFAEHREKSLPAWADRTRFNHFYRLATNTRWHGGERRVRVGDLVSLDPGQALATSAAGGALSP